MRVRNTVTVIALVAAVLVTGGAIPAAASTPAAVAFERTSRDTGGQAHGIEIADITNDGRADLIVTNRSGDDPSLDFSVLVYRQNVNGTLDATPAVYPISVATPGADSWLFPAVGDMDDDGDLDLVVGHEDGFDVFYQDAGVLGAAFAVATPYPVHEVQIADLNADGRDDTVYSISDPPNSYRYLRRFQKADHTIAGWASLGYGQAETFAVGDVTGDTRPDVILEDAGASSTVFVHSDVDQTFTATPDARIANATAAAVADVTGDARNDLVLLSPGDLSVMAGQGDGSLSDPVALGGSFGGAAVALEVADVNGDLALDAMVFAPNGTHVFLQDDTGALGALTCDFMAVLPTPTGGNETVAVGDLNGDGAPDAVAAEDDDVIRRLTQRAPGANIASSIDLDPPTSPIEIGEDTTVGGWLRSPGGSCGDPGEVHLERTLPGQAPQIVATAVLAADGGDGSASFSFLDEPTARGDVIYRVLWDGDTFHAAAASDPATVEVTKRASSLKLAASDTSITAGASTTLIATLTGGDRPASVSFFKIVDGVRKPVGTAAVGGNDKASLSVGPAVTTTFIAVYAATDTAKGATSGTVTITVAKKASSLRLTAPTRISFGKKATLVADLTGGTGTRKIAFYRVLDGGTKLLGRVSANSHGVASFEVKPGKNTKYVATFAGDATWTASTSPTRTVKVKVLTTGRMVHFGHVKNGVAFFVCCRAYFAFEVAPNHAGERVLVESEYQSGSAWKSFDGSSRYFRLRDNSTQEIFTDIAGGESYLFRIRACMDSHADHDGDCSPWVRFRFE